MSDRIANATISDSLRYKAVPVCKTCNACADHMQCKDVRKPLRPYNGIRYTSDGFDCALPVSIDSHSVCSYGCLYCFADNLIEHREAHARPVGQTSLAALERIFAGEGGAAGKLFRTALRYDQRNTAGYPCPVQLGAICDPCDTIERQQGWLLRFLQLAQKYHQPVRASTKGDALLDADYLRVIEQAPNELWVAFSIITCDDRIMERIDRRAPNATRRLEVMRKLSSMGVSTSLRLRPMICGITDRTPRYARAYATLIQRAAEAGARAVSYEVAFVAGGMTAHLRKRWEEIEAIAGYPLRKVYDGFGGHAACKRPAHTWTEEIMHAVAEEARACGMTVAVSDPVWKQLNDYGCCCGIPPDDPVFGNWQRQNATNALVVARDEHRPVGVTDAVPAWSHEVEASAVVAFGPGPDNAFHARHDRWGDKLVRTWDDLRSERGPVRYFQGALMPVARDKAGHVLYEYRGLERKHLLTKEWHVLPPDKAAAPNVARARTSPAGKGKSAKRAAGTGRR